MGVSTDRKSSTTKSSASLKPSGTIGGNRKVKSFVGSCFQWVPPYNIASDRTYMALDDKKMRAVKSLRRSITPQNASTDQ